MNERTWLHVFAVCAALGGAGAFIYFTSKRGNMTREELANFLSVSVSPNAQPFSLDLAMAAQQTVPHSYVDPSALTDDNAAVRRWALLLAAVGDHESDYGQDQGYFPKGDPTGYGDHGNAFGFFQLDKHFHWSFIQSPASQTVLGQAIYAGGLLKKNWNSFSIVADPAERERLTAITYNADLARVRAMIANGSTVAQADATTTQRNGEGYGANVVNIVQEWSA